MRTAIANDASPCVEVKQTGPVTVIVMKQPERLNALSPQLLIDLHQSLSMAAQDPHCRCLILTGSGRGFCAGADLSHFNGSDNQEQATDLAATLHETYHPIIRLMRGMEKPVITAVNGVAVGAGCSIALAGDIVLAGRSASFIQAFIKLGLIPDAGSTWFVPRAIGRARALQWMMSGEPLDAQTAEQWGLINAVHDDDQLMGAAMSLGCQMAAQATRALAGIKALIDHSSEQDLDEQLGSEARLQGMLGYGQDGREGISAFLHKRPAAFSGD